MVADEHDELIVEEAVQPSENCTIRLSPIGGGDKALSRQSVVDEFTALGVDCESGDHYNLVALHIPPSTDVPAVKRRVLHGDEDGRWYYEEGCLTAEWRAAP